MMESLAVGAVERSSTKGGAGMTGRSGSLSVGVRPKDLISSALGDRGSNSLESITLEGDEGVAIHCSRIKGPHPPVVGWECSSEQQRPSYHLLPS